jgi:N-dimethylarginine dimethylaminohydrolase
VVPVEVSGCHLKTACCYISEDTVLATQVDGSDAFCGLMSPSRRESLPISDTVLMPEAFPNVRNARSGFRVRTIDNSELLKAEAGVTCTSFRYSGAAKTQTSRRLQPPDRLGEPNRSSGIGGLARFRWRSHPR